MVLIVGLGNPGKKYQKTRHNIGFRVVDFFFEKNRDRSNFSNFKFEKKFPALISEGKFDNEKIILAKPQTFMNESGKAVKSLIKNFSYFKLQINATAIIWSLWVVHDDIDIPLGKIKISIGRGSAGHKGVESIIKELGTLKESLQLATGQAKNFVRFRIGIQPESGKPKNVEKFVLQKFNKEEEKIVKEVIKKTVEAIEFSLKEGLEKAMSKFNK
jgi:PTH1 family peptidyl-tRNA hydrolase